jgi:elongation factor P
MDAIPGDSGHGLGLDGEPGSCPACSVALKVGSIRESRIEAASDPLYLEPKDSVKVATLLDAIHIKRRTVFEFENTPFCCMDSEISTPTARGGQTLVRLKMRNLLTSAVLDKTFKAGEKFKEPDLQLVPVSYLYSDGDGSYFLDQDNFETLNLPSEVVGNALNLLVEGALLHLQKYNGNPISLQLPMFVELEVAEAEPAVRGDTSSGSGAKMVKLETGLEIRVPIFIKQGEKVKITTETREFSGRA